MCKIYYIPLVFVLVIVLHKITADPDETTANYKKQQKTVE